MVVPDTGNLLQCNFLRNPTFFPAMLNLPGTNRPGCLHHLSGLKNVEMLVGSVRADVEETKVTMGWKEVTFIREHWPLVELARSLVYQDSVTESFKRLRQNHRYGQGIPLFGYLRERNVEKLSEHKKGPYINQLQLHNETRKNNGMGKQT